jgi:hypothetical protein
MDDQILGGIFCRLHLDIKIVNIEQCHDYKITISKQTFWIAPFLILFLDKVLEKVFLRSLVRVFHRNP